jgi:hypothetical protein
MEKVLTLCLSLLLFSSAFALPQLIDFNQEKYDDCGNGAAQPDLIASDGDWTFDGPGGVAAADLSINYSSSPVQYQFNNINPRLNFEIVISYISDNPNRYQTIICRQVM